MRSSLLTADHRALGEVVTALIERDVADHYESWVEAGQVPRSLYRKLGDAGVIGVNIPERFGGGGQRDYRYNVAVQEAAARAGVTLGTLRTHMDVVLPYFLHLATEAQRDRWFPGLATGDLFTAIALSEPEVGSDLAGIRTSATKVAGGWRLTGSKTFITGGAHADLAIVLARTNRSENRRDGLTLLVVEATATGFSRGRPLRKLGLHVQDTVELFFDDVFVPDENVLGGVGAAFDHLTMNLAQERLAIAVGAVAQSETAIGLTVDYVRDRSIFGHILAEFQNTKFSLAAAHVEVAAARAMLDAAVAALCDDRLDPADAAAVKLFCTEVQGRTIDQCLQLFGGYGYTLDYPIARLYADARVTRIYAGTSEVMKSIVSKSMGL